MKLPFRGNFTIHDGGTIILLCFPENVRSGKKKVIITREEIISTFNLGIIIRSKKRNILIGFNEGKNYAENDILGRQVATR